MIRLVNHTHLQVSKNVKFQKKQQTKIVYKSQKIKSMTHKAVQIMLIYLH